MLTAALWSAALPTSAQTLPEWLERTELGVLFFGDAYWVAESHDPEIEGENGFWIRRIYLTLDHEVSERLDFRVRFEAASPGDFRSSDTIDPFVKDAWLRWRGDRTAVYAGLAPTPTWAGVEGFWGYRTVEKTAIDLQRMGSSRDLGVAVRGSFDPGRRFRYHAMLGNGSGTRGETNEGKKAMLSLGYYPSEAFFAEVYGDFEGRDDDEERTTAQAFVGVRWGNGRAGLQLAHQEREPVFGPSRARSRTRPSCRASPWCCASDPGNRRQRGSAGSLSLRQSRPMARSTASSSIVVPVMVKALYLPGHRAARSRSSGVPTSRWRPSGRGTASIRRPRSIASSRTSLG